MTALRRWEAPIGLCHGDHACWTFADDAEFSAALVPYLDEGRRRGEQLLLVGESRAGLMEALRPLPDRDTMLADGQLQVWATGELYRSGWQLDPVAHVQAARSEVDAALLRGRTGLRAATDVSAMARSGPERRRQLHVVELLAGSLAGGTPLTGMCLYDASLGDEVLGPLAVLHPIQHHGDRQPLAHLSGRGSRLQLHGELDGSVADDVLPALFDLGCAAPGREVTLDLSGLDFLDIAGARMLTRAVQQLAELGVALRLARPTRLAARCLELFDRHDAPAERT